MNILENSGIIFIRDILLANEKSIKSNVAVVKTLK
jgi:hypothetical protein